MNLGFFLNNNNKKKSKQKSNEVCHWETHLKTKQYVKNTKEWAKIYHTHISKKLRRVILIYDKVEFKAKKSKWEKDVHFTFKKCISQS